MTNPFTKKSIAIFLTVGALAYTACSAVAEEGKTANVDPLAIKIFDRAASFIAKQKQFSTTVEMAHIMFSRERLSRL